MFNKRIKDIEKRLGQLEKRTLYRYKPKKDWIGFEYVPFQRIIEKILKHLNLSIAMIKKEEDIKLEKK